MGERHPKKLTTQQALRIARGHTFDWDYDQQHWKCKVCGFTMKPGHPAFTCEEPADAPSADPIVTPGGVEVFDRKRPHGDCDDEQHTEGQRLGGRAALPNHGDGNGEKT